MTDQSPFRSRTTDNRIAALKARHAALDQQVLDEQKRPAPDLMTLKDLKREKLRLKEQIAAYEGVLRTLDRGPANRNLPTGWRA